MIYIHITYVYTLMMFIATIHHMSSLCSGLDLLKALSRLPGAKSVALWVVSLYTFTTIVAAIEGCAVSNMVLRPTIKPMGAVEVPSSWAILAIQSH